MEVQKCFKRNEEDLKINTETNIQMITFCQENHCSCLKPKNRVNLINYKILLLEYFRYNEYNEI